VVGDGVVVVVDGDGGVRLSHSVFWLMATIFGRRHSCRLCFTKK
jgi:hypothetical protein